MNIFFLHPNPRRCARWQCDKHVVKMIIEACQMLYTCHWVLDQEAASKRIGESAPFAKCSGLRGYKMAHKNHPCTKWVRASLSNYKWLTRFCLEMAKEYSFRYGGKTHGCAEHSLWLHENPPEGLVDIGFTMPAQAMPDQFKNPNSVVAYRKYYLGDKSGILKYTRRHRPHWIP
jgi:hypothetical protein